MGLHAAGLDTAAGIDFDRDALDCYHRNHPDALPLHADMYQWKKVLLRLRDLAAFDVVTVSSPCTPFSTAGRLDPADPRIQLTFNGLMLAISLRPEAIIFENNAESHVAVAISHLVLGK